MSFATQETAGASFSVKQSSLRATTQGTSPHRERKANRPACAGVWEERTNRPSPLRLGSSAGSPHFGEYGTVREKSSADATRGERT